MPATILKYWQNCLARGDKPRPVWMVVSLGKIQPEGYCVGWSISKRAAAKMMDQVSTVAGAWTLVRVK